MQLYDIVPPVLLLFLTSIFFWRQLVLGRALYWGDVGLYFLPMLRFLHGQLHAGHIPLWNPYMLCGAPYVGNPQTWALYPSSLFLFPMPAEHAMNAMIAFHVWLAGCGMYLFLRRTTSLGRIPCLLSSMVFMFGGQLVSKEQFPNMVQAGAYTPWILLAVDGLLERRNIAAATGLGVVIGLQLLAAHAQMTMLALYLALFYGLLRLARMGCRLFRRDDITREQSRRRAIRETLRLAGALSFGIAIALGLAAGQMLPVIELFDHAWRQRLSFKIVDRFYLPPNQLLNFTLPTLHGHPYFGNFTARGNFWETCCYVGWIPAILASIAVWFGIFRKRRPQPGRHPALGLDEPSNEAAARVRFWGAVFVLGVWISTGGVGKLYRLAYAVLPGFKNFHDPARCLLWASMALAILSGYGLHALMRSLPPRGSKEAIWSNGRAVGLLIALVVFVDLCRFGATLYPLAPPRQIEAMRPDGVLARVKGDAFIDSGQARVLGPDSARVWQRFATHRSYRMSVPNYCALWRDTLTPNLSMDAGVMDAFGYEPFTRLDAQQVLGTIDSGYGPNAAPASRNVCASLSGIYGVRYIVTLRVNQPDDEIARLASMYSEPALPLLAHPRQAPARVYLSRDTAWQPRARLTSDFAVVRSRFDAVRDIENYEAGRPAPDVPRVTLVAGNIQGVLPSRPGSNSGNLNGPVSILDSSPDRIDIMADAARPCLLVLADTLHPGWRATVDARPTDILSANGFVRAIPLREPGRHVVSFVYRPSTFYCGLYLSLLTLCVIVAIGVGLSVRRHAQTQGRKWTGMRRSDVKQRFPISR